MSGHKELTKDVDIDIQALFANIWKKKWLIAILSIMAASAIFVIMNSIAPRYQSSAQLIIEPRESQFTRIQPQNGGINANDFDTAAVLSQVQIIQSDEIALNTIKKLDLASKDEFRSEEKPSVLSDLFILAGLKQNTLDISPEERVLKAFKKRLKAYSIEQSRVIEILFWSNDHKLAQQITNTIADEYLKLQRSSKLETDINATKFLEPEIAKLREKVQKAEARVAVFRANSDILIGNNNALLATQQLSEVSTELSRVRAQRSASQAKVESVRSTLDIGASLETIPEVVASPLIQRLRERQVQLRAQISELSTTLLPAHPRLKALKSQVADFDNQIKREARGILRSLENNVAIALRQEKSLSDELGRLKAEAARAGEAEVERRALEREAVSERELLQAYMTKFREAAGRQSNEYIPINARIISAAHLPTESFFPKTIPFTIAGGIVTAILSMVGILAISLLNGTAFKTLSTPERESAFATAEIPPAKQNAQNADATTPATISDRDEIIPAVVPPPMSAPFAQSPPNTDITSVSLVAEGLLGMGKSRIAIVSPGGDEGSRVTWLLARKLANAGKTVALMDMTGSGITSLQMLGTTSLPGVRDVMSGTHPAGDTMHRDKISSVNILPIGLSQTNDAKKATQNLQSLISALSQSFDFLIVDCGYARLEDLTHVANRETVILISASGSTEDRQFEEELIAGGYEETMCVQATLEELNTLQPLAA